MLDPSEMELMEFAESQRGKLPDRFFAELSAMEADLARGRWPQEPRSRSVRSLASVPKKQQDALKPGLRSAILAELRLLLCGNDPRYRDVRERGKALSKAGLGAVSAYVAGAVGISLGVATAAVAFIALALCRLGVGVFCRITAPPDVFAPAGKSKPPVNKAKAPDKDSK